MTITMWLKLGTGDPGAGVCATVGAGDGVEDTGDGVQAASKAKARMQVPHRPRVLLVIDSDPTLEHLWIQLTSATLGFEETSELEWDRAFCNDQVQEE